MKNIGEKKVYFTGSNKLLKRVVRKDGNGKYWVKWYGQDVQVEQIDGYDNVTSGWRTVEKY